MLRDPLMDEVTSFIPAANSKPFYETEVITLMSTTTFVPKTITKPVELKRMTPPILMRLLKKHKSFFGRKKALPQSPAQIEYDRLTIVLQSPSEKMGAALMADLFYCCYRHDLSSTFC